MKFVNSKFLDFNGIPTDFSLEAIRFLISTVKKYFEVTLHSKSTFLLPIENFANASQNSSYSQMIKFTFSTSKNNYSSLQKINYRLLFL